MERKRIGIGIENYKEIIDKNYYYIDKTLLIKALLDKGGKVCLFTRPRRFGKTLALSMIRAFFEKDMDRQGMVSDNSAYFTGKKITRAGSFYMNQQGKYPVISLSLKSGKQPDFEMARGCILDEIIKEYERHSYILKGDALLSSTKERFSAIMERRADMAAYAKSLGFLSECLKQYHGVNTIILLDEYDVPLENAYFRGFYEEMTDFIRSLFESALKTNDSLEFSVITGCLRISQESIFTGLNNLHVNSILDVNYSEYFGFTEEEAEEMLSYYGLIEKTEEMKQWYDGYLFGKTEVYNPWSVTNYTQTAVSDPTAFPKAYWSNTSSNSIVREMIDHADAVAKQDMELLIAGGVIEKPIHETVTYQDVYKSQENLWNFLFFTGYLRAVQQRIEGDTIYLTMRIPNREVCGIFRNTIREWFEKSVKEADRKILYNAFLSADSQKIMDYINGQLEGSVSYYDNAESFYHGYLMGLLGGMEGYRLESNRERGQGRADLVLCPFDPKKAVIVIEVKRAVSFTQMEQVCNQALRQIEDRQYAAEFLREGYHKVLKYGICFCKKSCIVKLGK